VRGLPTTEEELRQALNLERLLILRADRQQAQNIAYRGRIAVIALAVLLAVTIPMAVAAMLVQLGNPSSVTAPLLLISSGGVLGGGLGAIRRRQVQSAGRESGSKADTDRSDQ
jgi:hypothetical protein